jgi:uncharacterized protein (TIRG00374 family)
LLRLAFAAALLSVLFWQSDPRQVIQALTGASPLPLLAAVALVGLDRALMAWRWFALLKPLERVHLPPFGTILRIFFVSTFVGTFLPASIGGDAVRAHSLSRVGLPTADAVASVFLDRMLGVFSILLLTIVGLLSVRDLASDLAVGLGILLTSVACLLTGVVLFSAKAERALEAWLSTVSWRRGREAMGQLVSAIRRYGTHHGALGVVLAASIGVQLLRTLQAYYLGVALGIGQSPVTFLAFIPVILLVMLLPITVNGLGTSQAAFIWLFSRVGTAQADAFALSILFVALGTVGNLPGAFLYAATPVRLVDTPDS